MDTTSDPEGTLFATKSGLDFQADPGYLLFCSVTGSDLKTAKKYLSKSDNDVQGAVQLYNSDSSNMFTVDTPIVDLIASVRQEKLSHLPSLNTTDMDRASSPTSNQPAISATNLAQRTKVVDDYSPGTRVSSPFSPSQLDGPYDEGSYSPGSMKSSISSRFVPSAGFMSTERREVNNKSCSSSNTSLDVPSPLGDHMDLDGLQQDRSRTSSVDKTGENRSVTKSDARTIRQEYVYETTTSWYGRLKAEGKGWEHIYVEGWEKCFKNLGAKY
jgi:hypothetical protein